MKNILALISLIGCFSLAYSQQKIPLYPEAIPKSINSGNLEYWTKDSSVVFKVSQPDLTIFLPEKGKENGTAIIICPGGGYGALVMTREGYEVAKEFNKIGVAAFVLKYRLPDDRIMKDKSIGPLQDAQQAIKIVRERASEWNLNPDKIGIMGFSAGGHLASTAGTHFNTTLIENKKNTSLRPDFMILVYPVISLNEPIGHAGTRENLLDKNTTKEIVDLYSNDLQVTPQTPPAFLIHGSDDHVVPVENSLHFYEALKLNKIMSGLHIYSYGEHGFPDGSAHDTWLNYCKDWLKANGWLSKKNKYEATF